MLTKLKKRIQEMLGAEAKIAHKLGLTPNKISIIGFILSLASAVAYAVVPVQFESWGLIFPVGDYTTSFATFASIPVQSIFLVFAVVFMLASGFCDTMDGIVARTFNQASAFGAFFDSVLDRYADVAIYAGIIIGGLCNPIWGLVALAGSVLVSYTRARAEGIGVKMESIGFAERAERMLVLCVFTIGAVFYLPVLNFGMMFLAVITSFTVVQRVYYVFKVLKK
ncbi:MAG: CDP-alcohol phosphatidyltransferase family protein [Candidatus Bathyarchaeota archaeon]|nr:CDP-alcohol phosphatidyltransferase family protein [Candidatus Termiticorpusculum sp.]